MLRSQPSASSVSAYAQAGCPHSHLCGCWCSVCFAQCPLQNRPDVAMHLQCSCSHFFCSAMCRLLTSKRDLLTGFSGDPIDSPRPCYVIILRWFSPRSRKTRWPAKAALSPAGVIGRATEAARARPALPYRIPSIRVWRSRRGGEGRSYRMVLRRFGMRTQRPNARYGDSIHAVIGHISQVAGTPQTHVKPRGPPLREKPGAGAPAGLQSVRPWCRGISLRIVESRIIATN